MDIDDTIDALVFVLEVDIILDRSQIIADVLFASGPGAGKDTTLFQSTILTILVECTIKQRLVQAAGALASRR